MSKVLSSRHVLEGIQHANLLMCPFFTDLSSFPWIRNSHYITTPDPQCTNHTMMLFTSMLFVIRKVTAQCDYTNMTTYCEEMKVLTCVNFLTNTYRADKFSPNLDQALISNLNGGDGIILYEFGSLSA